jgi:hypothetical protein
MHSSPGHSASAEFWIKSFRYGCSPFGKRRADQTNDVQDPVMAERWDCNQHAKV